MRLERVVFVYNANKPSAQAVARRGAAWCQQNKITPRVTSRRQFRCREGDLAVAVGGDGTLLRVASVLYPMEVAVLGVHMGSLGFLSSCTADRLEEALGQVLAGIAQVDPRSRLAARWGGNEGTGLNDVALMGSERGRMTRMDVWRDGTPVATLAGDGLIAASPTGASAYALACGGPILAPDLQALLLVPVAPHRLGARPLVLPATASITMQPRYPVTVMLDGDQAGELQPGQELHLSVAPAPTLLISLAGEPSHFQRLRDKLGWLPGPAAKGES
ncbi:MAG: NAD(+)/NADH kinase [Candidatus Bipolaricaulota bacterium]